MSEIYYITRLSDGEMFVASLNEDGTSSVFLDGEMTLGGGELEDVDNETKNSILLAIENSEQNEYDITKGSE